jgi:Spy/CpxP family protein refolding chaperone
MSKSKIWITIALVLVFATGVAVGVFAEKWWFTKRPGMRGGGPNPANYPSMARWANELGLTAEQQAKIQDIFKANEERIKGLRTDFYKNLGDIRDQMRKEIDAVLTPEQKQKMEAMIQKQMEQHRKEMERRPKPPRNPNSKPNIKKESPNEKEVDRRTGDSGSLRWSHPGLQPA